MGFSRQEYWSGLPFPSPGDLPNPGIEPESSAVQADSLPLSHLGREQSYAIICMTYGKIHIFSLVSSVLSKPSVKFCRLFEPGISGALTLSGKNPYQLGAKFLRVRNA